jgi:hypothetical protein
MRHLNEIECFVKAVELKSLTAAAKALKLPKFKIKDPATLYHLRLTAHQEEAEAHAETRMEDVSLRRARAEHEKQTRRQYSLVPLQSFHNRIFVCADKYPRDAGDPSEYIQDAEHDRPKSIVLFRGCSFPLRLIQDATAFFLNVVRIFNEGLAKTIDFSATETRRSGAWPYRRYGRLILEENWLPLIRSLDTFAAVTNAVCG